MSEGQIQLDADLVTRRLEARYTTMIQQLIRENAQLETYVAKLTAELTERNNNDEARH